MELLKTYFEKLQDATDPILNDNKFFKIFGCVLVDILGVNKAEGIQIFSGMLVGEFLKLYNKISNPALKQSYMNEVLLVWEIWDNLPNELFDTFCIELGSIMTASDQPVDHKSLLGQIIRFIEAKSRNSPRSMTPSHGTNPAIRVLNSNNPLQVYLAYVAKADSLSIKKVVNAFLYHFQSSKSISNEILF